MVRKVWFEERPHKLEARLKHEAEIKRMEERQAKERVRNELDAQRREEELTRETTKATRVQAKIGRAFPSWGNRFAELVGIDTLLAEHVTETLDLQTFGSGYVRQVPSREYWNVREPYEGYGYVMLGREIAEVRSDGAGTTHVRVKIVSPEIRRHAEQPGRFTMHGDAVTQTRMIHPSRLRLLPPALSLALLPRLPANLAQHCGMLACMPVTRDDPMREYLIDREALSSLVNTGPANQGNWGAATHFGLRQHFGHNEQPWRLYA